MAGSVSGNDVFLLMGIVFIFVGLGWALPYIHQAFNSNNFSYNNATSLANGGQVGSAISGTNALTSTVSFIDVILSIASMFFWTFGSLPVILDLFFVSLRIELVILIFRLFRGGSG